MAGMCSPMPYDSRCQCLFVTSTLPWLAWTEDLAHIIHERFYCNRRSAAVTSLRPAGLFSFGLLVGLPVRLRRPYGRETPAGFSLKRLATAFMDNPG